MGKVIDSSTPGPIKIPKNSTEGTGPRPGPINIGGSTPTPTPGTKLLIPNKKLLDAGVTPAPNSIAPAPADPAPAPPPSGTGGGQTTVPVVDANTSTTRNTDVAKGPRTYANTLVSKLAIFTNDGVGTTRTTLGGEFPSKLETTAKVNKVFALQWSRDKAGKPEKGNLYIAPQGSTNWLGAQSVTMPADAKATNVEFTVPNIAPGTYEMVVAGESGNSTNVRVNYTGEGPGADVVVTPIASTVPASGSAQRQVSVTYKPMTGFPKTPGYEKPELTLTLSSENDWSISEIEVEVISDSFNNGTITASGSEHAPIQLFRKTWKIPSTSYHIQPGAPKTIHLKLGRTPDEVNEAQQGVSTEGDWGLAYQQTTQATFRWSVDGQEFRSVQQPLHTLWSFAPWKENGFTVPPPPKGPVKIPGKK
jgi:hypothetical protein